MCSDPDTLVFDLWIYGMDGELREDIRGLSMKDVSGNTIHPPQWIRAGCSDPLAEIRSKCADLCVIELATVIGPMKKILSAPELERFARMREKRCVSFCAARLALKRLARRSSGNDMMTPPEQISTMEGDGKPLCPTTNGGAPLHCAASHDSRFAVAVVSEQRIGIDVEEVSERVLNGRHLYMHEDEIALSDHHTLGVMEASARIWTIKEAVAKAMGINLADAWRRTRVTGIGNEKSAILIDSALHEAVHATVDGHIFTFIIL